MIALKYLIILTFRRTAKSRTPIKILVRILTARWIASANLMLKTGTTWPPIIVIMAFNGGLIILYLFSIAISAQNKRIGKTKITVGAIAAAAILASHEEGKNKFNERFCQTYRVRNRTIMWIATIMIIIIIPIIKMTIRPFKTIKTIH